MNDCHPARSSSEGYVRRGAEWLRRKFWASVLIELGMEICRGAREILPSESIVPLISFTARFTPSVSSAYLGPQFAEGAAANPLLRHCPRGHSSHLPDGGGDA